MRTPEAVSWLATQLGADHGTTRQELEKLAVYAGPDGLVDLPAAMACTGNFAALSLDDALFAATQGDLATADRAVGLALGGGAMPVAILRAGLLHLERIHRIRLAMEGGLAARDAIQASRPPVFLRRVGALTRAVSLWPTGSLLAAIERWSEAERNCKRTGAPAEVICRQAVLWLANRAVAAASRKA